MTSPAPVLVVGVAAAVLSGDFALARWRAKEAVLARVSSLYDDGHDVVIPPVEPAEGRLVGAERCSP